MRRPARLVLASAALAPVLLVTGCAGQDVPVRGENGSGVDSKGQQSPGQGTDQTGGQSLQPTTAPAQ